MWLYLTCPEKLIAAAAVSKLFLLTYLQYLLWLTWYASLINNWNIKNICFKMLLKKKGIIPEALIIISVTQETWFGQEASKALCWVAI